MTTTNVAILGASGYTGAELIRLVAGHPQLNIVALTAKRNAGRAVGETFPHLAGLDLPTLTEIESTDLANVELAFCALPHGVTQEVLPGLPEHLRVIDLSADFRLRSAAAYQEWYGSEHRAPDWLGTVTYGLPEAYRDAIRQARVVACTGCYVATALTPLLPLVRSEVVDVDDIVIDAKSGASGAGRSLKEELLFCEVAEGCLAYGVGRHRHMSEIEQELAVETGREVRVSFTPHLLPYSRGILATIYLHGEADAVQQCLQNAYEAEPFVRVLPAGVAARTQFVRGSNHLLIGVAPDRRSGRCIVTSALDNLLKGASGQAVQNANIMLGFDERSGLPEAPTYP